MRTPILLHKDYTLNEEGYQLKLPLNLETIIPADDSVRLLSQFVEAMDLTDLFNFYVDMSIWFFVGKQHNRLHMPCPRKQVHTPCLF